MIQSAGATAAHGPGRPRGTPRGQTRARILEAARSAFSELGYDATTFQNVAARASVTRPAVNHYFANKQMLYRAVLEDAEAFVARAADQARTEASLLDQLAAFIVALAQLDEVERTVAPFFVTAALDSQRHPELQEIVADLSATTADFLGAALADAVERGELVTDVNIAAVADMLRVVLWGMGFYVAFVGNRDDSAAMIATVHKLLAQQLWQLR